MRGDRVVAVRAEFVAGPGWANSPLWVFIRSRDGQIREEAIQPEQQSESIRAMFAGLSALEDYACAEAQRILFGRRRPGKSEE